MLAENIKKIYLGASTVQKMYLGENLIYPREPADEYLMLGTTTGTTDFMIGESGLFLGQDCIQVHVVQKPDGNNEMYVKPSDVLKTPVSFRSSFFSDEGKKILSIDKWGINTSNVTRMDDMFYNCNGLTSLDLSNFNTSDVTDMDSMFYNCNGLTSLDLSNFNTSNVTSMKYMFDECSSLKTIDLSSFDTSRVTSMDSMFYNCNGLTSLDLSNFNTSNVTDMHNMFISCKSLTSIDVSSFNTSNVTDMSSMFESCIELASLNVSNFNTSNVTNMDRMFFGCSSLKTLDLRSFDTTNVTSMSNMFGTKQYSLHKLYLSSSFFNSTAITEYDFSSFVNWDDASTTTMLANAIKTHDGTGKTLKLSFGTYILMSRQGYINTITSKGWNVTYSQ